MTEPSALLPAEELALTIARAQVDRGEAPGVNTASVLVFALTRLDALLHVTPLRGVSSAKNLIHMLSSDYIDADKPVFVTGYDSGGEFGVYEVTGTTSTARGQSFDLRMVEEEVPS